MNAFDMQLLILQSSFEMADLQSRKVWLVADGVERTISDFLVGNKSDKDFEGDIINGVPMMYFGDNCEDTLRTLPVAT
jgi:hypothetical protein